ncbi:MAG: DUF1080 domain-containing protein [Burkholderiales bacterium]
MRTGAVVAGLCIIGAGLAGCASAPSGGGGWVTLFDGRNLDQFFSIGDANWRIEDGAVVADKKTGKENGFLLTNDHYRDFRLRVEFWASDDANSGIFMRCGNPAVVNDKICYEANIFDQRKDPSYGTGAVVHIAKVDPMPKAGGKWNTYDITVKGDHIVLVLNGQKTVDVRDKKFTHGHIALQYGAGVVKFRKVQIQPL